MFFNSLFLRLKESPGGKAKEASFWVSKSLEKLRVEMVPLQQLVKLGAIAFREFGSLCHVSGRDFEYFCQILAFELPPC